MVRAVIFDMDGTLIDTEKWLNKYWCQAALEAGYPMKPQHALAIRSLAGKYAESYLKSIFGDGFDYGKVRARRRELLSEHIDKYGIEKKPGVDEALDYLKKKGIKTAVATATEPLRAKEYLSMVGIYEKFDQVVCATMVENGKPEPDVYLYACEQIGEKPKDCIAVEDSPNGLLSACRAGLSVVLVPDLTGPDEETEKITNTCIRDLSELPGLLEKGIPFGQNTKK